ncbi:hypothetical protein ACJIZ3_012953 [Penstemon smallii]|uniref:Hapless 8 n=1 Tax=Penstemon smallii TaxID=265156 RepID=A0ABD3UQM0_9LAMI
MLSTENPPPADLSQKISHSNSINISSDDNNNKNKVEEAVDLLQPCFDDNNNFSIRDYVFSSRGKDIKNNWPFSEKNLKLCLNHGVKDVLPPFQSLDSVKNNPKSAVENITSSDVNLSEFIYSSNVGEKLAVNVENINSSGSEEDKELPSTKTTSQSCSDINLPGYSAEKPNKLEIDNQNRVKKCKLIVKLSNIGEPSSRKEDLGLNCSVVSEAMATKVCPVCKTFSSSSNTTLNAHIDQCLSGESTHVKLTPNSKVMIRHRIKPRKTRLMVEIYSTALHCTLEDLDRRNGTNWASNLGLQAPDLEICDEGKNKKYPSVNIEDNNEEGAVYIDSNGRKVRILSKFGDPPSNLNSKDDCEPSSKLVKKDKESKSFSSKKKKKYLVQKHKLLNCSTHGETSSSPMPEHGPEVNIDQHREFPPKESYKKENSIKPLKINDQMKSSNDLGMIKKWVVSKRTGLKKNMNLVHEHQFPDKTTKNLRIKSGDTLSKRTRDSNSSISRDENPLLHKRRDNLLCNSHDECKEQPCLRKRRDFSLLDPQDFFGKQSKDDGLLVRKRYMNPTKKCDGSLISSKKTKDHAFSFRGKEIASSRKTSSDHGVSSVRKNLLYVPDSKKNLKRKHLNFKKPRFHDTSGSDEEADSSAEMEKGYGDSSSFYRKSFSKIQKKRRQITKESKEGDMVSKSSDTSESDSHGFEKNVDSPIGGDVPYGTSDVIKETDTQKSTSDHIADGEAFIAFSKSLDSAFTDLAGSSDARVVEEMNVVNNEGGQVNYFADVDPIPIPGPPGSFLPSPGRMGSEELQGNSSLTTCCRIQSSEDEHGGWVDNNNMDSSDSPISTTTSMVSNTIAPRISDMSLKSNVGQHEARFDISENRTSPVVEIKDSQPCCCSRKEGAALFSGSLKHDQESQILRRRAMNSLPLLAQENKLYGSEKEPTTCEHGKNLTKSSTYCGVCESSPSPSVSTPVLRLMGKNLMVVNKDESMSPHQSMQVNGNIQNYDHHSFHHSSSVIDNMHTSIMPAQQHFDFSSRTQQLSPHPSSSNSFGGSFTLASLNPDQLGSKVIRMESYIRPEVFSGSRHKEVIVIDDSREAVRGKAGGSAVGIFASPMPSGYESRDVNPFYNNYQTIGYPIYGGSQMGQNANSQGISANMVKWKNFAPSAQQQHHPNSLSASLPSTTGHHLRSSMHFSPGF